MTEPYLLTPGPLTTSLRTKQAMLKDWGSWDNAFNEMTASVCADITRIVCGEETHVCVPLQGSGTFAVEAALGTLVPRDSKVLVPSNGAYCQRIARILSYLGREAVVLEHAEHEPLNAQRIEQALQADARITHVAVVHCETSAGILNPLAQIAAATRGAGRRLIVDAMSSFATLPIDLRTLDADAVIAASGKCIEGVPGMGFVIAKRSALEIAEGRCHSLAMDLHDQWAYMQKAGQWRYTPPTHVVAALRAAIDQFHEEGGQPARLARYSTNCKTLIEGMTALGFRPFLDPRHQAPIIVTFHAPADSAYTYKELYELVRAKGFILYPGKLTRLETFRVGCIGAIGHETISAAVIAVAEAVREMGVVELAPRSSVMNR
jgi:2-aminoethylphosphonate-pyruvate transaminase